MSRSKQEIAALSKRDDCNWASRNDIVSSDSAAVAS
jgi:hypothetical protein